MKTRQAYIAPRIKQRPLLPAQPLMGSGPTGGDGGGTTPGFETEYNDFDAPTFLPPVQTHDVWDNDDDIAEEEQPYTEF